jgi:hypothetical protein
MNILVSKSSSVVRFSIRILDKFRLAYDKARYNGYQPLPWLGLASTQRNLSTEKRWGTIEKYLDKNSMHSGSMMDVGCNVGYFPFRFSERGFFSIGFDRQVSNNYYSNVVRKESGIMSAAFSVMTMSPDNINNLPRTDVTVFFSVWHHWIQQYGYNSARSMLETLWAKTDQVLLFEGGEDTELDLLNVTSKGSDWNRDQLEEICVGGVIEVLGEHDMGEHFQEVQYRTLFAISRVKS